MASVKIDFSSIKSKVKSGVEAALSDQRFLNDIGETVVRNSVASSRQGKDPKTLERYADFTGKSKQRYISRRSAIAKDVGAGSNFRPARSNLTLSGQLLASNTYFTRRTLGGVILTFTQSGFHEPYRSNTTTKTITNKQLAEWHTSGAGAYPARRAFGISKKTIEIVKNKTNAQVRRNILSIRR